jgi:hypothetical protein
MTTTKFIFEPIFDAERELASDASRGRRRRTLTEAELEGLCAEARAEGFNSAEARALEDIAVATNEAAISVLKVLRGASDFARGLGTVSPALESAGRPGEHIDAGK